MDWLTIDLSAAYQGYQLDKEVKEKQELMSKRKELREIIGLPENETNETEAQETPGTKKSTVQLRLTILNELKQKKLISNQEYQQKREQILSEL